MLKNKLLIFAFLLVITQSQSSKSSICDVSPVRPTKDSRLNVPAKTFPPKDLEKSRDSEKSRDLEKGSDLENSWDLE